MIQDPHTLRPHYAKAAAARRRAKALRTLALCLTLVLAAGIAFRLLHSRLDTVKIIPILTPSL